MKNEKQIRTILYFQITEQRALSTEHRALTFFLRLVLRYENTIYYYIFEKEQKHKYIQWKEQKKRWQAISWNMEYIERKMHIRNQMKDIHNNDDDYEMKNLSAALR